MDRSPATDHRVIRPGRLRRQAHVLPGLLLSGLVALAALLLNRAVPFASPLLVAILAGAIAVNVVDLPSSLRPGLAFAARTLLRAGVALLGLQLVLTDIAALGLGMIAEVVAIVAGGIGLTLLVGRWLGVGANQRLLIACGFSICGAAAVAAVDGVADVEEEEVATAVALVVLFGTLLIPVVPLGAGLLGLSQVQAGAWAGGSIQEVAQVVAAAGLVGGGALKVGVVVKLARVLLLAPVLALIAVRSRSRSGQARAAGRRPPLVPLFVAGFLAAAVVRTTGVLPAAALAGGKVLETALLTAAMFALGCGVHLASLRRVGGRPLLLATVSTLVVGVIALGGPLLAL